MPQYVHLFVLHVTPVSFLYYRAMQLCVLRGIATENRPSVCPSVRDVDVP